jgi:hypothetical protein
LQPVSSWRKLREAADENAAGAGVNLSQYVLEPLRMDEEFVLYRAEHSQFGSSCCTVIARSVS